MGTRIGHVAGAGLRWDHFPFRLFPNELPSQPERYRVNLPLTLKQACEVHWRVREWKLRIYGRVVNQVGPPTLYDDIDRSAIFRQGEITSIDEFGNEVQDQAPITHEYELFAYADRLDAGWVFFGSHNSTGTGPDTPLSFISNQGAIFYRTANDPLNPIFYPTFWLESVYVRSPRAPYELPSQGSFKLILSDGVELVDTQGSWPVATSGSPPYNEVSIEMKATKFWPYANSQGQAVYDEDTGEQLVDPFS